MLYKLCLVCDGEPIFITTQKTRFNAIRFFCAMKHMPVRDLLRIYKVKKFTRPISGGIIHAPH